jgi:hypothetical protein
MKTTTLQTPASLTPAEDTAQARAAWKRLVARNGSMFQLAFAALWLARGSLATGWPPRLAIAAALAVGACALAAWGAVTTRGLAPRPRGPAARKLDRATTIATVAQLAVSCALPVLVAALGRPDLTVATISVTIGMLLLWLRARLGTPGHLTAGILLIVVPIGLALALTGGALTASSGLVTGAILAGSAFAGFRWLAQASPAPSPAQAGRTAQTSTSPRRPPRRSSPRTSPQPAPTSGRPD